MIVFSPERFEQARLAANLSRSDLAHEIRLRTKSKAGDRHVRGWEKGEFEPGGTIVAAVAAATGRDIEFFYESGGDDGELDEEAALRRIAPHLADALIDSLVDSRVRDRTEPR